MPNGAKCPRAAKVARSPHTTHPAPHRPPTALHPAPTRRTFAPVLVPGGPVKSEMWRAGRRLVTAAGVAAGIGWVVALGGIAECGRSSSAGAPTRPHQPAQQG